MSFACLSSVENASDVQESTRNCASDADSSTCHAVSAVSPSGKLHFIRGAWNEDGNVRNGHGKHGEGEECESVCCTRCEVFGNVRPAVENRRSSERCWGYSRYGSVLGVVSEDKPWEDADDMEKKDEDRISSQNSSSIGTSSSCTSEDGSGESEEVQSNHPGALSNLSSLEEALPCKRGLSRFYAGKSRSYSCLSGVTSAKDIAKPLNPYAKRRRYFSYLEKTDSWHSAAIQDGHMIRKHGKVMLSSTSAAQENALEVKEKACFLVPSRSYSLTDLHTRSMSSFGTLAGYSR